VICYVIYHFVVNFLLYQKERFFIKILSREEKNRTIFFFSIFRWFPYDTVDVALSTTVVAVEECRKHSSLHRSVLKIDWFAIVSEIWVVSP